MVACSAAVGAVDVPKIADPVMPTVRAAADAAAVAAAAAAVVVVSTAVGLQVCANLRLVVAGVEL